MKKKVIAGLLTTMMVMGTLAGCGNSKDSASKEDTDQTYTIGICNYVDDASLNQIVENVENQLEVLGKESNVTFDVKYDNCNADATVMEQIIADFQADEVDLMVGVATPVAMKMQSMTEDTDTPVVFAAVSDPVSAQLVESMEEPGSNVTGTSDYLNTTALMDLMLAANPEIKKVGLLYDAGQDSSTTPIADAKKYLDDKNIQYVEKNGTTNDEVLLAAKELVAADVDAVFTPTDNTIMTAELSIYETFAEAKIPHFCGADSFALNGAFVGYGVDYANLGVETANMVKAILLDGEQPETLAVKTFDNGACTVNTEICKELGFDFEELKKVLEPLCTEVREIKTAESFDEAK